MFVFKAAVVGAGTMGGEIAQVIAAAGIPVVLKDVDQKFVDVGLELDYQLKRRPPGWQVVDLLFIRRAMRDSLRRTLTRFGRELAADRELLR